MELERNKEGKFDLQAAVEELDKRLTALEGGEKKEEPKEAAIEAPTV